MKKLVIVLLVLVVGFCISSYAMIPPYVSSVEIEVESEITLYVGDEITIKAVATPEGVDSAYFLWTIDNGQVIELTGDDGTTERIPPESAATIKAMNVGTVTVTVYAELWPEPGPYEYTPNDSVTINVVEKPFVPESTNVLERCYAYNASGEKVRLVELRIPQFTVLEENSGNLLTGQTGDDIAVSENILSVLGQNEHFIFLNLKTDDAQNPYPAIAEKSATLTTYNLVGGGYSPLLGKNYRLYYAENETAELTDITEKMTSSNKTEVKFILQQLGFYVICFDPAVYSSAFYLEEPQYDEEGNLLEEEPYWKNENLNAKDIVTFPPMPEKEGYVFTGWKVWGGSYRGVFYPEAQPHYVASYREYYATWCPEDAYEPIKIEISSEQTIKKGKEDGEKITLTTNYGIFASEEEEPSAWGDITEKAIEEENKEEMIAEWKKLWNVVGSDEIMIQSATRVDDKTVELVLMGNSKNKYTDAELKIEFASELLLPEPYEEDGEIIDWNDTKIQMDEDGVRRSMYISGNAVQVKKQAKSSGGGGSISYTVTFDTDGGSIVEKQKVQKNTCAQMPEAPQKDGYIFIGWFKDEAHTETHNFEEKVTENIILYAAWEEKTIVLTIGEKTATVFGKTVEIDAAPMIQNDRTMLPIRFIAESLGAEVLWDEETRTVTVKSTDKTIQIVIGEAKALVGEEEKELDSVAFIENNRTYLPLRFIAENLGAKVTYEEETRTVTIAVQ